MYFGLAARIKTNLLHFEKQQPLIGKLEESRFPYIFLHSESLKVSLATVLFYAIFQTLA